MPIADASSPGWQRHWERITPLTVLLYPPSLAYRAAVAARRLAYARGVLRIERLPVPVLVVGNISVGGTGKTPLVLWLASLLAAHGRHAGIVSRGYGGRAREPQPVAADSGAERVGDEPLLLAQRSGCPVWVGIDRAATARALLRAHPHCDVILSDDGLQHYRLGRDLELAVIDGARGLGNGLMLPAGPLREPAHRLAAVDAIVLNGRGGAALRARRSFRMELCGQRFLNLASDAAVGPGHFAGKRVHALAGIGNPRRFFEHLTTLGLRFEAHAFPDHHRYRAADLAFADADAIVMTEKDAVKCAAFASGTCWALRVDAVPEPGLGEFVMGQLGKR
jgi:tetraacyldisaccharide 4'-kinase